MSDAEAVLAYVGLGGNVGDAVTTVREAIAALEGLPGTRLQRASRCYRTPAWGLREQPDFVNAVACVETTLAARALLEALLEFERGFGRERIGGVRWGPRTLDLDLLTYGDFEIDEPGLRVPHPYLHRRAFVLVPLLEIAPEACIPGRATAAEALAAVAVDGIEAIP